jgi:hypothetical protein
MSRKLKQSVKDHSLSACLTRYRRVSISALRVGGKHQDELQVDHGRRIPEGNVNLADTEIGS